jgi:serine/threonine protein kinase
MLGKKFAHYVILQEAGAGGMGVVYRAKDETLQREVALKIPSPRTALDDDARERMLREARAASALNHPHICTIYEVGEFQGRPYIAMEFVGGESLSHSIPPKGLPPETVLDFGMQIADALECAHSKGILHRDLKAANIRLTQDGQLKVLDFGLALNVNDTTLDGLTRSANLDTAGMAGTLAYMAPELLEGNPPDVRSDIWALGVLLYELASGVLPFQGRTGFELTTAILRETPPAVPTHVAPGLRSVIMRCLAKRPEQRYQHASGVQAALEALQSSAGLLVQPAPQTARTNNRNLLFTGAGVLVVTSLLFWVFSHFRNPTSSGRPGRHLRLLLSSQDYIGGPALSPDGKMVAYIQQTGGHGDLFVSRVAGGEHVRLTNDESHKEEPQFSPDGERIAFGRKATAASLPEICIIPSLGGAIVPVASGGYSPAWSPDGNRIAYITEKSGGTEALMIAAVDGSETRTLLTGDGVYPFLGRASWSSDGKQIAVTRSRGGENREIWLVSVSGGTPKLLSQDAAGVVSDSPVFTPDGLGVIHRSNRGGASNLWWQPLDGKVPVQLTSGPGPDATPSVARDGTVAFLNSRSRNLLFSYRFADAATDTLLSDSSLLWAPAISSDGKEIAYSRDEPDGSWHLWVISSSGGSPRQLTSGKAPEIYPRFMADGSSILFNTWGKEPLSIWRVPLAGGPARPITSSKSGSDSYADASPDGRSIVFARTEDKVSHIYIASADGSGAAQRLIGAPGTVPRWSPDGQWISFSPSRSFSSGVYIVHPDGTGLRRLTESGGWAVWWPGSDQIGFQSIAPDGNAQIQVFTLKTGELRTLPGLHFIGSNFPFDVSRDAKWLATTNYQHISDEVWLLEPEVRK